MGFPWRNQFSRLLLNGETIQVYDKSSIQVLWGWRVRNNTCLFVFWATWIYMVVDPYSFRFQEHLIKVFFFFLCKSSLINTGFKGSIPHHMAVVHGAEDPPRDRCRQPVRTKSPKRWWCLFLWGLTARLLGKGWSCLMYD